jgi:ABC-type bacteriocin/lantibiotic exporter with double-glycine peptidase domain
VLEGQTQELPGGQHTILRAASGAGKSTLLRLLAGLLDPERGQVSVLGHDPRTARGLVAYLPQRLTLLETSIGANLVALSGAPLEHVLQVAKLTGLDTMLAELPMGTETLVGTGGNNLSAGQRQLVALTAVFATSVPVVLLDEAVAQLDAASRARIQWQALGRNRTIVSVQHM